MKSAAYIRMIAFLLAVALLPFGMLACTTQNGTEGTTEPSNGTTAPTTAPTTPPTTAPTTAPTTQGGSSDTTTIYDKYVVVIGVDGAGAFFQQADTPNMDRIFANGAVTHKGLTESPTISAQCWGSLLHGVTCGVHGLTNDNVTKNSFPLDSQFPSIFRVARENNPTARLASFSNYNAINLGIIEDGLGVDKATADPDAALTENICRYVNEAAPMMLFVQFDDADHEGHSTGYGKQAQLNVISKIDGYIGQIYAAYEAKGILDKTLFIVTADHGGTGTSHGGLSDAEKYITFAVTGPNVEKGEVQDFEIRDTAAIVNYYFGYTNPESWTARVPSGVFKGVTAGQRPTWANTESPRYHETIATPTKGSNDYITNVIKNVPLRTYLTFDGSSKDAMGSTVKENGKLYYVENGYFGGAVSLDDGYLSLENSSLGKNSFSLSFWINTTGSVYAPFISNTSFANDSAKGFTVALRDTGSSQVMRVFAGGTTLSYALPKDFRTGWMHVTLVIDRTAGTVGLSFDFGKLQVQKLTAKTMDATFDALATLNIGQDGTGNYSSKLGCMIDEFMFFDGVLTQEDIDALAKYYKTEPKN